MIKRFTGIFFIFLLLLSSFAFVQPISATNIETTYYDTSSFVDYFKIWGLVGTVSADGYVYGATCIPTLTHDSAKQYWVFYLYLAPQDGEAIAEIPIPTSYGGISVEYFNGSAWLTADGISNYKLSVPYRFNNTDKFTGISYSEGGIPADWAGAGAPTLVNGLGEGGSLYRVQLAISTSATVQLRITLHYLTSTAFAVLDRVNDNIAISEITFNQVYNVSVSYKIFSSFASASSLWGGSSNSKWFMSGATSTYLAVRIDEAGEYSWSGSTWNVAHSVNVGRLDTGLGQGVFDGTLINTHVTAQNGTATLQYIGKDASSNRFYGIIYNFTAYDDGSAVVLFNSSSYNPTSGLFEDFSVSNNDGTPYGNVQYKCYNGNSFEWTLARITPALNADDAIMNIYGEMGMFTALCMIIIFFVITLVAYIKLQNKTIVLLSVVFGLMINILSLSSGIPFVPFPQIFFSIVELLVLIYARRMNM